jgi:hypothetical protein
MGREIHAIIRGKEKVFARAEKKTMWKIIKSAQPENTEG